MIRETLRMRFDKAVGKAGLAEHRDALLAEARECVHFFLHEADAPLPVGMSKVGGSPDLPESVEWPAGVDPDGNPLGKAEFLVARGSRRPGGLRRDKSRRRPGAPVVPLRRESLSSLQTRYTLHPAAAVATGPRRRGA